MRGVWGGGWAGRGGLTQDVMDGGWRAGGQGDGCNVREKGTVHREEARYRLTGTRIGGARGEGGAGGEEKRRAVDYFFVKLKNTPRIVTT